MKRLHSFLIIFCFSLFIVSCSTDEDDNIESSVVGVWDLTELNIANLSVDLNNDTVFNNNILEEISCANNEILTFEENGVVTSSDTFNSKVDIFLNTSGQYSANIECAQSGTIGFASSYIETRNTVEFNGSTAELIGNQIIRTFTNEIEIFDEAGTEVVETRDLILVYTRQ